MKKFLAFILFISILLIITSCKGENIESHLSYNEVLEICCEAINKKDVSIVDNFIYKDFGNDWNENKIIKNITNYNDEDLPVINLIDAYTMYDSDSEIIDLQLEIYANTNKVLTVDKGIKIELSYSSCEIFLVKTKDNWYIYYINPNGSNTGKTDKSYDYLDYIENTKIKLIENDFDVEFELIPDTTSIRKIKIQNEGNCDTYIRVHIGIPYDLDFKSNNKKFITLNHDKNQNNWNWNDESGKPNTYITTIENEKYIVYIVTYNNSISPNKSSDELILYYEVDKMISCEEDKDNGYIFIDEYGNRANSGFKLPIFAEGVNSRDYTDPFNALNNNLGNPNNKTYTPNF